jgi:hypothetical protein
MDEREREHGEREEKGIKNCIKNVRKNFSRNLIKEKSDEKSTEQLFFRASSIQEPKDRRHRVERNSLVNICREKSPPPEKKKAERKCNSFILLRPLSSVFHEHTERREQI